MESLAVILLVSMGPVMVGIITAVTAAKSNAQWRERRAAKAAAAADVVPGRGAH